MIRKTTIFLLCLMLAFSMIACQSPSQLEGSTSDGTTSNPSATAKPEASLQEEPSFQPLTLVDNDDVCFKITGIQNDPIWGYSLQVFLENKTDKELMFSVDDVSVNGFMCDPFWAESVAAGKKSNTVISWFESDFEENGITEVQEIVMTVQAYDSNDYLAEEVLLETFTINP